MILFSDVLQTYGIKNVKILLRPAEENLYQYKWLRIEGLGERYVGEECILESVYFRNDVNGRFEKSMPYLVLLDMVTAKQACIVIEEHTNKKKIGKGV